MKRILAAFILFMLILPGAFTQQRDALVLYQQGLYDEAIEVCMLELEDTPKRMDAYVVMGWSQLKQEKWDDAMITAAKGYEISPTDYRILEILGEAHFYQGNNLEALHFFEQYAVIAPDGDRTDLVYYFMGEIFIRLGEFNHADIALTTALYHSPNAVRWWARLGYAREMAQDYVWAINAYQKALQLNATFTEAERGIARVQEKMENG